MKQAAYSLLEIKSIGTDEQRVISGLATSVVPDRIGDVIVPAGVQVASDIPLFLNHDPNKVVGRAQLGKPTADGIPFTAKLPKILEPGALKDRVDEAWQMIRTGLLRGVSIGFRVLDGATERIPGGGTRYLRTEVLELSLCPVPMHQLATIENVKAAATAAVQRAHWDNAQPTQGSVTMATVALLTLNAQLELSVSTTGGAKSINLQLSRIAAQHLADELQSFATTRKGIDGQREVGIPAEVLPEGSHRQATRSQVVRLDNSAHKAPPGAVYLGAARGRKPGVVYLDQASQKRPVVRLDGKKR